MPGLPNLPTDPEKLLSQFDLMSYPVNVLAFTEALGISASFDEMEDEVSGLLVVKDGRAAALINKNQHPNRQRFTLAHECGHFVLHWNDSGHDRLFLDRRYPMFFRADESVYARSSSSSTTGSEEMEANAFAAALLMPRALVTEFVKKHRLGFTDEDDVSKVAKAFQVSEQAMLIRLKRLRLLKFEDRWG